MSNIAESFQILYDIKEDIRNSIEEKGVTVGDAPFTDYASKIDEIVVDPMDGSYDEGYIDGRIEGYNNGHKLGYTEGYNNGRVDGYVNGENDQKDRLTTIEITENGNYTREDGYSEVSVSVDLETPYNNGYSDGLSVGDTQGYDRGHKEGMAEQKAKLSSISITENGPYTSEDGFSQVIVNVQGDPNAGYDDGYNTGYNNGYASGKTDGYGEGYSTGTTVGYGNGVADTKAKMTTLEVTENGTYDNADGYNKVITKIDLETPYNNGYQTGVFDTKAKMTSITIDANGNYMNTDGYKIVTVQVPDDGSYNEGYTDGYSDGLAAGGTTGGGVLVIGKDTSFAYSNINAYFTIDCKNISAGISKLFSYTTFNSYDGLPLINTSHLLTIGNLYSYSNIVKPPLFDTSNVVSMAAVFLGCKELKEVPLYNTSKAKSFSSTFNDCKKIETIPQFDTGLATDFSYMFAFCENLKTVPYLNFSNATNLNNTFIGCTSLTNLGGFEGLKCDIDLSASNLITRDSVLNVFNGLATVAIGQKITLSQTVYNILTDDDKTIATNKGWTINQG